MMTENRQLSYSRYWTGSSLQLRLMRRVFSNVNGVNLFVNDIPQNEPPLQASFIPIPRIRNWSKLNCRIRMTGLITIGEFSSVVT